MKRLPHLAYGNDNVLTRRYAARRIASTLKLERLRDAADAACHRYDRYVQHGGAAREPMEAEYLEVQAFAAIERLEEHLSA